MKSFIADSYAWLAYLDGNRDYKGMIEENAINTPSVIIAEVGKVLFRRGVSEIQVENILNFIRAKGVVLDFEYENAFKTAKIVKKEKLHFLDAMLYSYATAESPILTGDLHFKGKQYVEFVK